MVADLGHMIMEKQKLGDAVDAAALAGVQDLINDPIQAEDLAREYAQKNGLANPQIQIDQTNQQITVSGQKDVAFFFAKALGMDQTTVYATATAQTKVISGGKGFVPLAVVQQNFQFGQRYTLKYDPNDANNGNFGALALGGTGAANYRNNLKYGYQGTLAVGMSVPTETGNMSGPTKEGIQYRLSLDAGNIACCNYQTVNKNCHRVMYLPVIDSLDISGRNEVTIVGFAAFYLEDVSGNGNESIVEGRFLKMVYPGDWDTGVSQGYGLFAAKLVQ